MARFLCIVIALCWWAAPAHAETCEVKMLNRGAQGPMVFEPDDLPIRPGDTVWFRATHKSHNAASIDGMVPPGFGGFKGKIDKELRITFDQSGYYGFKCAPHYSSGMVMPVKVGAAQLPASYRSHQHPGPARQRFNAIFARMDAGP